MTGLRLAHFLETSPFVEYEARLLTEQGVGVGLKRFVDNVVLELKAERFVTAEVDVPALRHVLNTYPASVAQREGWHKAIVSLLS